MNKLSKKERAVQESLGIKPEVTICTECHHFGGKIGRYSGKCFVAINQSIHVNYITGKRMYYVEGKGYVGLYGKYLDAKKKNIRGCCSDFTYNTRNWYQVIWFHLKHSWRSILIT